MHEAGVVHGDLTTSNIMIKNDENHSIVFIDFGLASTQPNIEDKAVDLYVLERAFISTHPGCELMVRNSKSLFQCFTWLYIFIRYHRFIIFWIAIDFLGEMPVLCSRD